MDTKNSIDNVLVAGSSDHDNSETILARAMVIIGVLLERSVFTVLRTGRTNSHAYSISVRI